MNKTKILVIAIACIIGILGIYYEYHDQVALKVIFPDNKNYIDEEVQVEDKAAADIFGNISYTDEELQALYQKYDIKENDLKFARGELPNYLEGTILYGDLRVIVSETGEPREGMKEGEHYDVVLSEQEMSKILEKAREDYIEKYGVDPANPKLDEVNGYLIPIQEAKRLVSLNMITVAE